MISIAINQSTDKYVEYKGKSYKIDADGEVYRRYVPPDPDRSSYWNKMKDSSSLFCRQIKHAAGILTDAETKAEPQIRPRHYKTGSGR